MSEHKKCPCCGGKGQSIYASGWWRIVCTVCYLSTGIFNTKAEAWAAWDRRDDGKVKALVAEHKAWALDLGAALLMALQGDYSKVDDLAHELRLEFASGAPTILSSAIKSVEEGL